MLRSGGDLLKYRALREKDIRLWDLGPKWISVFLILCGRVLFSRCSWRICIVIMHHRGIFKLEILLSWRAFVREEFYITNVDSGRKNFDVDDWEGDHWSSTMFRSRSYRIPLEIIVLGHNGKTSVFNDAQFMKNCGKIVTVKMISSFDWRRHWWSIIFYTIPITWFMKNIEILSFWCILLWRKPLPSSSSSTSTSSSSTCIWRNVY